LTSLTDYLTFAVVFSTVFAVVFSVTSLLVWSIMGILASRPPREERLPPPQARASYKPRKPKADK
jgi:hypothetical protein